MARLAGVDLPRDKRMEVALTYIYGIGRTRSMEILAATGIGHDLRTKDLTDEDLAALREYIESNLRVEGDLRREVQADIRRKIEIGCYQGIRHRRGLPVRGQRTKTNARSRKGPNRERVDLVELRGDQQHGAPLCFRLQDRFQRTRSRRRPIRGWLRRDKPGSASSSRARINFC